MEIDREMWGLAITAQLYPLRYKYARYRSVWRPIMRTRWDIKGTAGGATNKPPPAGRKRRRDHCACRRHIGGIDAAWLEAAGVRIGIPGVSSPFSARSRKLRQTGCRFHPRLRVGILIVTCRWRSSRLLGSTGAAVVRLSNSTPSSSLQRTPLLSNGTQACPPG